jgi:hypothetical protein
MASNALKMNAPFRGEKLSELKRVFNISLAIVHLKRDESEEHAWRRHVEKHPDDKFANVKVFNYSS